MTIAREEIKEKLTQAFKNSKNIIDNEEIELSLSYHLNEEYDLEKLVEFYNKSFQEYQNQYSKIRNKVNNLITFVSLTKTPLTDKLEELPIIKTMKVFNKINTIYLLYTEESEKKYNDIKNFFSKKNRKIKIQGKKVNSEDMTSIHQYLKSLVLNGDINKENTLIDSTPGLKMVGIAMYKLAVEYGIKSITWRDFQMPAYNKLTNGYEINIDSSGKRVPLLAELKFMQEPVNENIRIYQAINKEISNFNFSVVADNYNNMGMKDYSFFYTKLGELINLNTILELDPNSFYENIYSFLKMIFNYKFNEKIVIDKIRDIIIKLAVLVNYKIERNQFNIEENEIEEEKERQENLKLTDCKIKEKLYYSLVLKYLFANSELCLINAKISKPIFQIIFGDNNFENDLDINKYLEILFDTEDFYNIVDYLNFSEILKDETDNLVYLRDFILYIDKFNIKIDLQKDLSTIFFASGKVHQPAIPLVKLLEDEGNIEGFDFIDEMKNVWNEKKFEQNKTTLKNKVIPSLNELIKEKLRENKFEELNFILDIKEKLGVNLKQATFSKIKINPEFLSYK